MNTTQPTTVNIHQNPRAIENKVLEIALACIRRGWNPVPIPFKKKKPIDHGWQNRTIDEAAAPRFFNAGLQNIGIQLGPASTVFPGSTHESAPRSKIRKVRRVG